MSNASTGGAAPKVTIMRSQLSRARGMGAAGSGVHHWKVERITAIALVPLTTWFIYAVLHLLGAPQAGVHRFVHNPWNAVLLLAIVTMTFHHMQLGLQVVLEDYVSNHKWQMASLLLNKAVALILGLLCVVSILRMAFTA
ncbi:succinate dehydrogenase, hydrophobic membrane anchor protein [Acidisphaera sp. L21]|uniref:succinate dehydrogenase, hydrophobic membrane anchor protein n=1 Tax=Acidisphaera sp. L21 TaxID=1641851 RepID=UPI0020B13DE6|nr:succinate dehydrogenase, hydrophobic membrane anchor protein [Acidisphaera sp. L21]